MAADDSRPKANAGKEDREGKPFLPPLDFSSIVILLYFPALIQLGIMEEPGSGEKREDLALAKRNIDLLDLLRDKTKGNLDEEEAKFLDGVVDQLKMAYLQKADLLKM